MARIVILDFSGIYGRMKFWKNEDVLRLDFQTMEGTNCYCDDEAAEEIGKQLGELGAEGIHFLDSGNYHYATKLWTDRICQPFDLLVLDHHTDMQQPAFGGILSCGGWLRTALEENKFLQRVCLMGPSEKMAEEDEIGEFGDRLLFFDEEKMQKGFWREFLSDGGEEEPKKRRPLYISLDKDILCEEEAAVNWDQGTVRLSEVLEVLEAAFRSRPVIGADLCGENPLDMEDGEQLLKADSLNEKLLGALKRWMGN
ncbi:MAG: arginase family protein [Lachnospiraceae bacterium]|nr:arginase family protein [Lachnospiraceae bacterium]